MVLLTEADIAQVVISQITLGESSQKPPPYNTCTALLGAPSPLPPSLQRLTCTDLMRVSYSALGEVCPKMCNKGSFPYKWPYDVPYEPCVDACIHMYVVPNKPGR